MTNGMKQCSFCMYFQLFLKKNKRLRSGCGDAFKKTFRAEIIRGRR